MGWRGWRDWDGVNLRARIARRSNLFGYSECKPNFPIRGARTVIFIPSHLFHPLRIDAAPDVVRRALLAAGLSVRRIDPNRLRQFARARGALATNDRLDARLIAEYVATMPTHVVRHDPTATRIAEIVTILEKRLTETIAAEADSRGVTRA